MVLPLAPPPLHMVLEESTLELLVLIVLNAAVVPPLEVAAAAACKGQVVLRYYRRERLVYSGCDVGNELMDRPGAQGVVPGLQV